MESPKFEKTPAIRERSTEEIQDAQIGLLEWELEEREERYGMDHLTGARKREVLIQELDQSLQMIRGGIQEHREGVEPLKVASLIFIDLDKFKQVNDTKGHLVGDGVLKKVTGLLKGALREEDLLVRYGGDEFVVFLSHTDEKGAMIAAEKLRVALDNDSELKGFGVTASLGVCSVDASTATDSETFIKHADEAAYVAKRAGGNRVEVYT